MKNMATRYGEDEEDNILAPKEPQVTSQDLTERKAARSLRIKRRQEALKKADQSIEESGGEEEAVSLIEQATAAAAEELQRLALDGTAKVTNVKVTTDEREVIRRTKFFEKMQDSLKKIEDEAAEAQIQYEAISAHWEHILAVKDPLDIDAEMKLQKEKCDSLLKQKDDLISQLNNDLIRMDNVYYEDLEKQDKDIKELSDRIEKQVTIMQRAYEKQLNLIDVAINIERDEMIDHNNKRWEALYKQRDKEEIAHMEYRYEQLEDQKQVIDSIMWEHYEKYREAKIELESLTQELQQELEKLKATCIINTEKIGYTYQVLKKREEENVFVRSQQKRKLNKMSDIANALRAKIHKAAEDGTVEEIKADSEIIKLVQTMDELEKKSDQFANTNHYKFSQVWRMSTARCMELSKQLRQGEVALHAHILAEPAPLPPQLPLKNPLHKYEHEHSSKKKEATDSISTQPNDANAKAREKLIRHILQLVADNTGFLVEDRLLKLIAKYQLSSRNLCTLDAIFMALEIQAEDDINLLCETFLNNSFCPICVGYEGISECNGQAETSTADILSGESGSGAAKGARQSLRGRASLQARSVSASTSRSAHIGFKNNELSPADQLLMSEADEIIQKCGDPQGASIMMTGGTPDVGSMASRRPGIRGVTVASQPTATIVMKATPTSPFLCPLGHDLEIEPMQVLTALTEFISVFVPPEKKKLQDILDGLKPPSFETPSRRLTSDEINQYWSQWKNIFSEEKDRFWDGVLVGLNNYLTILQERETVHEEVAQLRRRNGALRRLVRGALPELPVMLPRYLQPAPLAFTAPVPDEPPLPYDRLPPI